MAAIMLNIEPDRCQGESQNRRQWDDQPCAVHDKKKDKKCSEKPGQDRGGLEIHLWAIATRLAGLFKVGFHPASKLENKTVAAVELQIGVSQLGRVWICL